MQYLYPEGEHYVFMDLETYDQMSLSAEDLAQEKGYLLPSLEVQINFYNNSPIGIELPAAVVLKVTDTETVVKGQTAAGSGKPATVETGLRLTVPSFVKIDDKIRVNTETGEYMERAD
jgi:elongation factor P